MDEIWAIFISWQFLLIGGIVFLIMAFFNGLGEWAGIGFYLWRTGNRYVRRALVFFEATKVLFLPIFGFGLGCIPQIPRPGPLESASQLSVALLYSVAGLCSMMIVKLFKQTAEARGIDVEWDLDPKAQRKLRKG